MRETNVAADIPPSIAQLERRARRRMWLVSWLPVFAAFGLGAVVTIQVKAARDQLIALRAQLSATETRRQDAEQARAGAETQRVQMTNDVAALQQKLTDLEVREARLREAVDIKDPQVAIAKIRRELGGRTAAERADSLWRGGQDALNQKRPEMAEKLFLEAVQEDPSFAPAINGLGLLAATRGDRLTAEKFYLRAVAADPKYQHGLYNLAHLYRLMKKYDKAAVYANRTLELNPNYPGAQQLLSELSKLRP